LILNHIIYDILTLSGDVITSYTKTRSFPFASSIDSVESYSVPDASPDGLYLAHGFKRWCTRSSSSCVASQVLDIRDAETGEATCTADAPATGCFVWTIPNSISSAVKVQVVNNSDNSVFDESDYNFYIQFFN